MEYKHLLKMINVKIKEIKRSTTALRKDTDVDEVENRILIIENKIIQIEKFLDDLSESFKMHAEFSIENIRNFDYFLKSFKRIVNNIVAVFSWAVFFCAIGSLVYFFIG